MSEMTIASCMKRASGPTRFQEPSKDSSGLCASDEGCVKSVRTWVEVVARHLLRVLSVNSQEEARHVHDTLAVVSGVWDSNLRRCQLVAHPGARDRNARHDVSRRAEGHFVGRSVWPRR